MTELVENIRAAVDGLPLVLQVLALLLVAVVPFLEGDVAAGIGVVAGVPWALAAVVSFAGTALSATVAVALGARVGGDRHGGEPRARAILRRVERFGVPLAMVVGGFLLSVPLNAFVMSAARLNRRVVLVSALVSATVNVAFVTLALLGVLELVL
jgi:hypothetical protein